MGHLRFRFDCVRAGCQGEPGIEAQVHEIREEIVVVCELCGGRRPFPKDWLSRENPGLIADTLRDRFRISIRYFD